MKLNALRKVGALAAVSAVSLGYAVAGPYTAPAAVDSGFLPPPPPPSGGGGSLWDSVGATLSTGYDSDYIFRGYDYGHDSAWTQLDLSVPLGDTLEFSVGAWYQNAFNGDGDSELDIYASLAFDLGTWGLEVGFTHYAYPEGIAGDGNGTNGDESNEVYVSVGTTLGPVDVAVAGYYDFDLENFYVEATAGTSFPLNSFASLDPSIGISFMDLDRKNVSSGGASSPGIIPPTDGSPGTAENTAPSSSYSHEDSGLNHIFARLELPIQLTESATLTPYVAASWAQDVADDNGGDDYVWGGIALAVEF